MATVHTAIRARMGSTPYYVTTMKVSDLVQVARPASEQEEWATSGLTERLQRELNDTRVLTEIAPYLASSPDRFFGALILLLDADEEPEFESFADVAQSLPKAYKTAMARDSFGFLTIDSGDRIILDGQHRFAALREVVISRKVEGKEAKKVANDEVTVIIVPRISTQHTRKIFNKVNRYAKKTSRGDDILTSEDDGFSILTRLLTDGNGPLAGKNHKGESLVNYKNTTIADRSVQLTTLSALYETVRITCEHYKLADELSEKKTHVRPDQDKLDEGYERVQGWWTTILDSMPKLKYGRDNTKVLPELRAKDADYGLLFKPATHIVLFQALSQTLNRDPRLALQDAVDRLYQVDWKITSPLWRDVLINSAHNILTKKENYNLAADLLTYLVVSNKMPANDVEQLRSRIATAKGEEESTFTLPTPLPN
ncbi:DNA sulfur modification protein DndB [Nocardiopsis sp. FIRDI 009]|uniref:DNA sulfur modification protein DndB n=1 Tax=Nocardiopsis sp. FIRDI 009 TaxID=714197 RepID=UPI0013005D6A|nr:DNA sulfur modification protein DndB [Nocardiopsis sp. FIRDI 009]